MAAGVREQRAVAVAKRAASARVEQFGTPQWANGSANPFFIGTTNTAFNNLTTQYAAFLSAAGKRYAPGSPHGTIQYRTIWSEPNSPTFWMPFNSDSPRRYAYMHAQGAKALKAADPAAKVAPGPTGPNSTGMKPLTYIARVQPQLAKYNAGRYTDGWAHNPYWGTKSPFASAFKAPSVGIGNMN